jgi:hypothetical protein
MNDADDNDLGRRLQSVDRPLPFDADAFTKRVIAERARRRKRRVTARCAVAVALAAGGLALYSSRPFEPPLAVSHGSHVTADTAPHVTAAAAQERIDELDALLRRFEQQRVEWERLEQLADRLSRAEAALAAARREQHERQLAYFRAELSADVEVPDLTRLYVDPPDDAPL